MIAKKGLFLAGLIGLLLGSAQAAEPGYGLTKGTPELQSAGPLAFGPEGILFIGDPKGAAIFAVATGDKGKAQAGDFKVEGVDGKIAALLGTDTKNILISDLAVNPISGTAYLSVSRGKGPDAAPVIVKVDGMGKVSELALKEVNFAKTTLPNAPSSDAKASRGVMPRMESITGLVFVDGRVFIAGLSNEEFASKLRSVPFPFTSADAGTSVEIYHGAHGKFETNSPVRTFATYKVNNEDHLLAAYTCTPLVKFPVSELKPGSKVKGTTVAELGNMNRPLDMIVYQKDGKDYVLLANNNRGMMKISTEGIDKKEGITAPVKGGGLAGLKYEKIEGLKDVYQMCRLDKGRALILKKSASGGMDLEAIALP